MPSSPSRTSHGASSSAVAASSHHQPSQALASRPASSVNDRYEHAMVSLASMAMERRLPSAATRSFHNPTPGMMATDSAASAMPSSDSSAPVRCESV